MGKSDFCHVFAQEASKLAKVTLNLAIKHNRQTTILNLHQLEPLYDITMPDKNADM